MSETQEQNQESSTIRQMREQIEKLTNDLKAERSTKEELETKVKEAEQAQMTEIQRLQSQLEDQKKQTGELSSYRDKAAKFDEFAQKTYEKRLAEAPEDIRDELAGLSQTGDWSDRLGSLENAFGLVSKVKPTKAGTNTEPGATPSSTPDPTEGGKKEEEPSFNPQISLAEAYAAKRQA